MRDDFSPPQTIEGFAALRSFLASIGIFYKQNSSLSDAIKKSGVPYAEGWIYTFDEGTVRQFVRWKTGVSYDRWIAQRLADLDEGGPAFNAGKGVVFRFDLNTQWPLWVTLRKVNQTYRVLRDPDGVAYATRKREEAECWDDSWCTNPTRTFEMRGCLLTDKTSFLRGRKMLSCRGTFSIWAPMTRVFSEDDSWSFIRVPAGFVGESSGPETACVLTNIMSKDHRHRLCENLARSKLPHTWFRWFHAREVEPVTLDPVSAIVLPQYEIE